ncbi:MAG: PilZ domain-containing protein [Myxococcales bacterium]|nr:PilZ domain-containing protein [Myxococcales bacterium]MCB9752707.1 PilZ domain-containing protein [Myxococcales bacterium]
MTAIAERRSAARIDKVFRVLISTEDLGDQWYVARNISTSGMFVEMSDPLPLRTKVIIRFQFPGDEAAICAIARIQNHYYLQYAADCGDLRALSGVGLRFLRFIPEIGAPVPAERLN